jgi:hypothetical protein
MIVINGTTIAKINLTPVASSMGNKGRRYKKPTTENNNPLTRAMPLHKALFPSLFGAFSQGFSISGMVASSYCLFVVTCITLEINLHCGWPYSIEWKNSALESET